MELRPKFHYVMIFALLLFFHVHANPLDAQRGISKFDEVADMNEDLINIRENDNFSTTSYLPHRDGDETNISTNLASLPNLKYDVELLESENLRKETDGIEEHFRGAGLHLDTNLFTDEDIEVHKLKDPKPVSILGLMTIFTIFGVVVLIIYAALMTWRNKLEQRYGQRVLLVSRFDDDDYMHQMNGESNSRR